MSMHELLCALVGNLEHPMFGQTPYAMPMLYVTWRPCGNYMGQAITV